MLHVSIRESLRILVSAAWKDMSMLDSNEIRYSQPQFAIEKGGQKNTI